MLSTGQKMGSTGVLQLTRRNWPSSIPPDYTLFDRLGRLCPFKPFKWKLNFFFSKFKSFQRKILFLSYLPLQSSFPFSIGRGGSSVLQQMSLSRSVLVMVAEVGRKIGTILWFGPPPGDMIGWWSNMKSLRLFSLTQVKALQGGRKTNPKLIFSFKKKKKKKKIIALQFVGGERKHVAFAISKP